MSPFVLAVNVIVDCSVPSAAITTGFGARHRDRDELRRREPDHAGRVRAAQRALLGDLVRADLVGPVEVDRESLGRVRRRRPT